MVGTRTRRPWRGPQEWLTATHWSTRHRGRSRSSRAAGTTRQASVHRQGQVEVRAAAPHAIDELPRDCSSRSGQHFETDEFLKSEPSSQKHPGACPWGTASPTTTLVTRSCGSYGAFIAGGRCEGRLISSDGEGREREEVGTEARIDCIALDPHNNKAFLTSQISCTNNAYSTGVGQARPAEMARTCTDSILGNGSATTRWYP
jgi:hypothetical protein